MTISEARDGEAQARRPVHSRVAFRSIRARVAIVVVAGVFTAVLLASLANAWRDARSALAAKDNELNVVAAALAATISTPLARGAQSDVVRALRAIRSMPSVGTARVIDGAGEVVVQFGSGVVLRESDTSSLARLGGPFSLLALKSHMLEMPIVAGGIDVGTLQLIVDVSDVKSKFLAAVQVSVLVAVLAAWLGVALAIWLQQKVTEPIITLTRAMRSVQKTHDFSGSVRRTSSDETGDLVDAFNDMLEQIRLRDARLRRHRDVLEQKVVERTRDLERARRDAEAANAAKSDFLATMSHEIRTPMNGMLVMAELLKASQLDGRQQRYADVIAASGKSLLAIVNDVLDMSKIEAGRMELESVAVCPAAIAQEVTLLFGERAAERGIRITSEIGDDVPAWIKGDPVRLKQVVSNLVSNAVKFTEDGGITVRVAGTRQGKRLRISVTDTGIGIEPDALGRIFDAFTQADQSTTRKFGGTGIGLAICKRLARAMGGDLSVHSRSGSGSTFTLDIPVEAAEAPVAEAASDPALQRKASFAGRRVLAADDNAVNLEVLGEALALVGADVVKVVNGAEAVEAIRRERFDLVFMDCSMPVLDGFEATRAIRARERAEAVEPVPIVALTAHVLGRSADAWRDAGMSDCMTKPFTLTGIAACMERWLGVPVGAAGPVGEAGKEDTGAELYAVANAGDPILDHSVLDGIEAMQPGGALLAKVAGIYIEHAPAALERLKATLADSDGAAIAAAAHALKSLSLNIGALRVAAAASAIEETAARSKTSHEAGGGAIRPDGLAAELDSALDALQAIAGRGTAVAPVRPRSVA